MLNRYEHDDADRLMRSVRRIVPARGAVAHTHSELADAALEMMRRNMRAQIVNGTELEW